MQKGSFVEWLLIFLSITVVLFFVIMPESGRRGIIGWPSLTPSPLADRNAGNNNEDVTVLSNRSEYSIRLNTGNAKRATKARDEYITIENRGDFAVNITGWRLENGKKARTYVVGGKQVHYASDVGIIPEGAKVLYPGGSVVGDIILNPGEEAVVTTGSPPNLKPALMSFKENSCTGYLEETYEFETGVNKSCIRPNKEAGIENLEIECQDYIDSINSCHAPEFGGKDEEGERCDNCIDGTRGLSSMCRAFIRAHYSYEGCLAHHITDEEFEGDTWHVYLFKPWEMWEESHETISLYDSRGYLIAEESY